MFLRKPGVFLGVLLVACFSLAQREPRVQAAARYVEVPDFQNMTQAALTTALTEFNRQSGAVVFKTVTPPPYEAALVLRQQPAAHARVIPGSTPLVLTWSQQKTSVLGSILGKFLPLPPVQVQVPDVVGQTRAGALGLLDKARLRGQFPPDASGFVRTQSLPEGTSVALGTTVVLTMGPQQVPVPPLFGLAPAEASASLARSSLTAGAFAGADAVRATVARQFPLAGSSVDPGTRVDVYFAAPATPTPATPPMPGSDGEPPPAPQHVSVPDLKGMTAEEALAALGSYGLRPGGESGPATGRVSSERPVAGTKVDTGSRVGFMLKLPQVTVPYLVDRPVAEASDAVSKAGLQLEESEGEPFTADAPHVVLSQQPLAGASVGSGSVVAVVIGDTPLVPRGGGVLGTLVALAQWWVTWIAVAALGGLVFWVWPRKVPDPPEETAAPPNSSTPSPKLPECALMTANVSPWVELRPHGPALRFKVAFATRKATPLYRMGAEPSLQRKNTAMDEETR